MEPDVSNILEKSISIDPPIKKKGMTASGPKTKIGYWISKMLRKYYNFKRWWKIIQEDSWTDYEYLLILIRFKLQDMYDNWGRNTYYIGDLEDKAILKQLLDDINLMINIKIKTDKEYQKISSRFFRKLDRHHTKFWF